MKTNHRYLSITLLAGILAFSPPLMGSGQLVTAENQASEKGWIGCFDGKTLDGWVAEGDLIIKSGPNKGQPVWSVKDGAIRCDGSGFGFLRYKVREFSDFVWELEYQFDQPEPGPKPKIGNSGVGIRTGVFDPKKSWETRPSVASYEIQLLDEAGTPPSEHSTGSLYRFVAPKENATKASPASNRLKITCKGPVITIELNGKTILEKDQSKDPKLKDKPLKGFICLQNHSSGITFRNLRIRDMTVASEP